MKPISSFLEKFKGIGYKEKEEKEKIIKILKELLNIELSTKDLEIKDKNLRVKIQGAQKTEIILNKRKIIDSMNGSVLNIF